MLGRLAMASSETATLQRSEELESSKLPSIDDADALSRRRKWRTRLSLVLVRTCRPQGESSNEGSVRYRRVRSHRRRLVEHLFFLLEMAGARLTSRRMKLRRGRSLGSVSHRHGRGHGFFGTSAGGELGLKKADGRRKEETGWQSGASIALGL